MHIKHNLETEGGLDSLTRQVRSWQRFTMQDQVTLGMAHSPRAGTVWHGSFMEDGCYFLRPSWSLGRRASADVKNEEEGEDGEERKRETKDETEKEMHEDRQWVRRKWKTRGWQFKWRSRIKRKKREEDERKVKVAVKERRRGKQSGE